MLNVTTEVKVPEIEERERRHYPYLHNVVTTPHPKPRARRYIPHGYADEGDWRPHPINIHPVYTEFGPAWRSRPRHIPSMAPLDYRGEFISGPWFGKRCYPYLQSTTTDSMSEWVLYSEGKGYDSTMRSKFEGIHKASCLSHDELTHLMLYGKKRNVCLIDSRNNLTKAAGGDKSYQAVEYSKNYHKESTSIPMSSFGHSTSTRHDTFVPLQNLALVTRPNYVEMERRRKLQVDRDDVRDLENWRPSSPLGNSEHTIIIESPDLAPSPHSKY